MAIVDDMQGLVASMLPKVRLAPIKPEWQPPRRLVRAINRKNANREYNQEKHQEFMVKRKKACPTAFVPLSNYKPK